MARNCSYNCSTPPQRITFNADITGPGVSVRLLIALVTAPYFMAYQPELDPFRDADDNPCPRPVPFRPNPVDLMVLRFCRRIPKAQNTPSGIWRWSHLDTPLTKCVLAMSDLQLATGIAILISGYSQLHCGLSSFHWLIIGRLAWFASVTHLTCLTFLRNYLYNRKAERKWRLLFMSVLFIMLIPAVVPTGNYLGPGRTWEFRRHGIQLANDYAICHFSAHGPSQYPPAFVSMIILILIAVLGFLFRIVKLFRPLSLFIGRVRNRISQRARQLLWVLYGWKNVTQVWRRVLGNVLYYPLLALFLAMRVIMDNFSSMFFEVYWLIAGFSAALWSFIVETGIVFPFDDIFEGIKDKSWSFGQVMPVILLVLPLITILETLNTGSSTSSVSDFDPDKDYYQYSSCPKAATVYIFFWSIFIGACTCVIPY
ncbi:hypothetical protein BDV12DRAFT_190735 [Aspergillus spectabilis]